MTASGKTKPPISSHPVFPAIVALWFAALLGIGSMVLPVVLIEKLVSGTGLAAVLPAAQPPLGATARILVAVAAAGIGAVAGLSVARKVVAAQAVEPLRRRTPGLKAESADDAPAKRPISAREELGVDRLDAELERDPDSRTPIAGRRRPLSVTEEKGRSDFFEHAPLPGGAFDVQAGPLADIGPEAEPDTLDLGDFAEPAAASHDLANFRTGILDRPQPAFDAADGNEPDEPAVDREVFAAAEIEDDLDAASLASGQAGRQIFASSSPLAAPRMEVPEQEIEMSERVESNPLDARPFAQPAQTAASEVREPILHANAVEPDSVELAKRPLRELGMVELVERFAQSLQRHAVAEPEVDVPLELPQFKAGTARVALSADNPAFQPAPIPTAFEAVSSTEPDAEGVEEGDALDDPAAPTPPAFAPPPAVAASLPAALQPIAFDDDEVDEDEDFAMPLGRMPLTLDAQSRPFARPDDAAKKTAPVPASDQAAEDRDDEDDGEGYSSLLAMKSPLGGNREFVRIDDDDADEDDDCAVEPVVVFPGQQQFRRATPASDGPSREPLSQAPAPVNAFRPFEAPAGNQSSVPGEFANPAMPTRPAEKRADPGETERALREALEKLQRMSGAA